MSSFACPECRALILEGENGEYVTGCIHYPIETEINKIYVTGCDYPPVICFTEEDIDNDRIRVVG
jgi:hypothetical protein